jgi:hypothetical protein
VEIKSSLLFEYLYFIFVQGNEGVLGGFQMNKKARAPMTPRHLPKNKKKHSHSAALQESLRKTKLGRMRKTNTAKGIYRRARKAVIRQESCDVRDIPKRKPTK